MCNGESCRIEKGNEGPTLNHVYNNLLQRWGANGTDASPECEDCGCDLTGKEVYETSTNWLCAECKEKDDETYHEPIWQEDFYAGRYVAR
jgi:hypothetical protein